MRQLGISLLLAFVAATGCKSTDSSTPTDAAPTDAADSIDSCAMFFGNPNDQTGLGPDMCLPECVCGDASFIPPSYDAAFVNSLVTDWRLATPYPEVTADPYAAPAPAPDPDGTVCAVLAKGDPSIKPRLYDLVTYPSEAAAKAAGASVTHFGHCGVCSTLENLAVYITQNDLTAPVRSCGLATPIDGGNAVVACLQKLGFDLPCAEIWAFNTANTKKQCLAPCLANLTTPYNLPDGALNDCLQCDEDQSGPVFKAIAGRTRRNSGLPNAICRPCSEVKPLVHAY